MIQIDKNVAIPRPRNGSGADPKRYPIEQMGIGDSFGLPCRTQRGAERLRGRVQDYARKYHKNKKITTKSKRINSNSFELRVWLVGGTASEYKPFSNVQLVKVGGSACYIRIDKNVAIDSYAPRARRDSKMYPLGDMRVGDSFAGVCTTELAAKALRASILRYCKRNHPEKKITTRVRKLSDFEWEVRCWLLAVK